MVGAPVRRTIVVQALQVRAFAGFTEHQDTWIAAALQGADGMRELG